MLYEFCLREQNEAENCTAISRLKRETSEGAVMRSSYEFERVVYDFTQTKKENVRTLILPQTITLTFATFHNVCLMSRFGCSALNRSQVYGGFRMINFTTYAHH